MCSFFLCNVCQITGQREQIGLWCNTNPIRENKPNTAKIKPNRTKIMTKDSVHKQFNCKEDIYYDII